MRLALAAAIIAVAACSPRREARLEERVQVMDGLTLSQTRRGSKIWILRAKTAVLREDARVATLELPVMKFYEKGKAVSLLTARSGEVGVETHEVLLSSEVVMDSYADKTQLTTEYLVYTPAKDRLFTTADVLVRRPEGVLRGKGMEAKPDLSEIRIHRQRTVFAEHAP